ncbi:MAG: class I SAM-dependent methyltransferase [Spirochaetales bacterium]|nr:class I SAM-dependent methyltransferase [Spirochaetales bacterium]
MISKDLAQTLSQEGYGVIPPDQYRTDMEKDFLFLWEQVRSYTMTSIERSYNLYTAVKYVVENSVPGDLVECGVWKGGSCMLMARTLLALGATDRNIYLYDTFNGMTEPSDEDVIAWNGKPVKEKWEADRQGKSQNFTSWAVSLTTVKRNMESTGYPPENIFYIAGDVRDTLRTLRHDRIACLRLDTDWYDTTALELERLYPHLVPGGVLILDDYGHFKGARKAVDDYFDTLSRRPFLSRIDYTGRICVKIG